VRPGAALLLVLALAGCAASSTPQPTSSPSGPTQVAAPAPHYGLALRVSQERADGPAMPHLVVETFLLDEAGRPTAGPYGVTDADGIARWSFPFPVRLAVRAAAPGWTREGGTLDVGPTVTSPDLVVSERDAFLVLYRSELHLAAAGDLMTSTIAPAADGSIASPLATGDLAVPDGAQSGYLARLSAADVRVRWQDTPTTRADLAAGLAWDGHLRVAGGSVGPSVLPGPREAAFTGKVPADRPSDLQHARLQAAAVVRSAAVGDVPLSFEATLQFGGVEPAGLPPPCVHLLC